MAALTETDPRSGEREASLFLAWRHAMPFFSSDMPFSKTTKMPLILVKKNHENLTKTKEVAVFFQF